jgi:hypothetical protein
VGTSLFGGKLASAAWKRSVQDGAVSFSIESDNGLSLRKTFRHRPAERGVAIEWKLENRGASVAAGQQLLLSFAAPALTNRTELAMFGTSAWAIAAPVDGDSKHAGASAEGGLQELLVADGRALSMAGSSNRFFGGFLFPLDAAAAASVARIDVESLPVRDNPLLEIKARSMPRASSATRWSPPASSPLSAARLTGRSLERTRTRPSCSTGTAT